jgi:DNA-binding transcriptional MerR regulator
MINVKEHGQTDPLDLEWLELIKEAKQIGLSFDEIQQFLQFCQAAK